MISLAPNRKSKLTEHIRRHTGEKRFTCLFCKKHYSGSHDLRKHLHKVHPSASKHIQANKPLNTQILSNLAKNPQVIQHQGQVKSSTAIQAGSQEIALSDTIIVENLSNILNDPNVVEDPFPGIDIDVLNEVENEAEINVLEYVTDQTFEAVF